MERVVGRRIIEHAVPDGLTGEGTLRSWQGDLLQRMAVSLARQEESEFAARLAEAEAAAVALEPDNSLLGALFLHLAYYRYQAAGIFHSSELHHMAWCQAVYELSIPALPGAAEAMRYRLLIQVLCKGDAEGYEPLTPGQYFELAARVPFSQRSPEYWYNVAGWAFRHAEREVLDEAYAAVLTNPGNYLATASWLRINLMHLLLEKRAGEADVLAYLRSISHPALIEEFEAFILPAVRSAGLAGSAVTEALAAQRRILAGPAVAANWFEPPTRHLCGSRAVDPGAR